MPYKNREKYLKSQNSYYRKDPEKYKWLRLKNSIGLTKDVFYSMLEKQDNKCALCQRPFESLSKRLLHIDHCHETGKIRGLLCMPCNVGLGMLGDNEESLEKALSYLKGELN